MQSQCSCGETGVPILYGMPGPEAIEALHCGELVLGGCDVAAGLPSMACPACGARWGALEFPEEEEAGSPWD